MAQKSRRKKTELPQLLESAGYAYAYFPGHGKIHFGSSADPQQKERAREQFRKTLDIYISSGETLPDNWKELRDCVCDPDYLTVEDLVKTYLKIRRAELESRLSGKELRRQYSVDIRACTMLVAVCGDCLLNEFGEEQIADLIDHLSEQEITYNTLKRLLSYSMRPFRYARRKRRLFKDFKLRSETKMAVAESSKQVPSINELQKPKHRYVKSPVDDQRVLALARHEETSPMLRAMLCFHLETGCRPEEVCRLRSCDIVPASTVVHSTDYDARAEILSLASGQQYHARVELQGDPLAGKFVYRPAVHKNARWNIDRVIHIPDEVYRFLKPLIDNNPADPDDDPDNPQTGFLFHPAENQYQVKLRRHQNRKTPPQQGRAPQLNRPKNCKPRYDNGGYHQLIERACQRAFPYPKEVARIRGESESEWAGRINANGRLKEIKVAHEKEFFFTPKQVQKNEMQRLATEGTTADAQAAGGHTTEKTTTGNYVSVSRAKAVKDARRQSPYHGEGAA